MDFKCFEDQLFETLTEDDEHVRVSKFLAVSSQLHVCVGLLHSVWPH